MNDDPGLVGVACAFVGPLGADVELVHHLARIHRRQWHLEDVSRDAAATDAELAEAKRHIDSCNADRHRQIDRVDASLRTVVSEQRPRLYGETPGEVCDRLLIVGLRRVHLMARDRGGTRQRRRPGGRADDRARLEALVHHLVGYADQYGQDLAAGRAAHPPRAELKLYGNGPARASTPGPPRSEAARV